MKKIKKAAFIGLTIIFCLAIYHEECFSENWVHVITRKTPGKLYGTKYYIDVDRIKVEKFKGEIEIYGKNLNPDKSYDINHILINYKEQLYSILKSEQYNARGKLKFLGKTINILTKEKYGHNYLIQKYVDFVMVKKEITEKKYIIKRKPMPVTEETTAKVLKWAEALPNLNTGIDLIKAGKYREALVELNMAIRIAPTFSMPYEKRAKIYLKWEQYDKAWDDVKKCQSLNGIIDPELLKELRKASGREK